MIEGMRRLAFLPALLLALCCIVAASAWSAESSVSSAPDIELYAREGCRHCDEAKRFLRELETKRPGLHIVVRDVVEDPAALRQLQDLARRYGAHDIAVPTFYLRGQLIVGYADAQTTGARIIALLDQAAPAAREGSAASTCAVEQSLSCGPPAGEAMASAVQAGSVPQEGIEIPVLGKRVTVSDLGLPLFTIIIGLLDGFNPCSMWVLIFMIAMLASLHDRRKMLLIAGVFVAVQGIAYFAFMAAWLNLFFLVGISRLSEIVLGLVAALAGLVNLKDFFAFGKGVSLSIPDAAKPMIYARVRRILQAENMAIALFGATLLAIMVQVVELMCTSGFPALYTRILTQRHLDYWSYYGYLLLYNAVYMLDDLIVLAIGVVTLSQRRLQEHEGKWLKLLSGLAMLGLALYLLVPR